LPLFFYLQRVYWSSLRVFITLMSL
jgi:hypothetical protein